MGFLLNILFFLVGISGGILLLRYNYPLTQFFGHAPFAERYLGDGGTYTMWKLLGVALIVGTIWYVF